MKRDGQWARAQLQARDRAEIALPLELPIWGSLQNSEKIVR